jgi:hypothetical protein
VSDGVRKPIRLPFDFGDVVYYRHRPEKIAGIVTGFIVRDGKVMVLVVWVNDLQEGQHNLYELTTEFEPSYQTEP